MYKYGFVSELASPSLLEVVLVGDGVTCGARASWNWGCLSQMDALYPIILLSFILGLGTGLSSPSPSHTPGTDCCPTWVKSGHPREEPL